MMFAKYMKSLYDKQIDIDSDNCIDFYRVVDYFQDETTLKIIKKFIKKNITFENSIILMSMNNLFDDEIKKFYKDNNAAEYLSDPKNLSTFFTNVAKVEMPEEKTKLFRELCYAKKSKPRLSIEEALHVEAEKPKKEISYITNRSHQMPLTILSILNLLMSFAIIVSQLIERTSPAYDKFDLEKFALDNIVWFTVLISSFTAIIRNNLYGKYEMIWLDLCIIFVYNSILITYVFILISNFLFLFNTSVGIAALKALDVYKVFFGPDINSQWFEVVPMMFLLILIIFYYFTYLALNCNNFIVKPGKNTHIKVLTSIAFFIIVSITMNLILLSMLITDYHSEGLLDITNDCECENGEPYNYCYATADSSCLSCETEYFIYSKKIDGMNSYCVAGSERMRLFSFLLVVLFLMN